MFGKKHKDASPEKGPVIIEIPQARRVTSDLEEDPLPLYDPYTCIGCRTLLCLNCGLCHMHGCGRLRVVCGYAQEQIMSRNQYPEDEPPKKRGWFW